MIPISVEPSVQDYISLEDHHSQTPVSFFHPSKPVLHLHTRSRLISRDTGDPDYTDRGLHSVYVSSENLTLFGPDAGFKLLYPSISLHAVSSFPGSNGIPPAPKALYMQVDMSAYGNAPAEQEEPETKEVWLMSTFENDDMEDLFTALSSCSDLNPDPTRTDPVQSDRIEFFDHNRGQLGDHGGSSLPGIPGLPAAFSDPADGGLQSLFPKSGVWITADNVNRFFDAEGNFIPGGAGGEDAMDQSEYLIMGEQQSLGLGAGRVRQRDEMHDDEEDGVPDVYGPGLNTKWRRTH